MSVAVSLLGLATLWAWVVIGPIAAAGPPGTPIAWAIAYPLLDLALVGAALVGPAGGVSANLSMTVLVAGVVLIGAGDAVYAARVAHGAHAPHTLLEGLWPIGAVLVAAAAWSPGCVARPAPCRRETAAVATSVCAALLASAVLVSSRFAGVPAVAVGLAGATVLAATVHTVVLHRRSIRAAARAERAAQDAVRALATAVDAKDSYTNNHSLRVCGYAVAIARELGLPEERVGRLAVAGTLHDVGKISVPDDILRKPGRLTPAELERMKSHSAPGSGSCGPWACRSRPPGSGTCMSAGMAAATRTG